MTKSPQITLALVAHDSKKDQLVALAVKHQQALQKASLVATGTTGQRIKQATSLKVRCMLSGPLGGDAQLAALVVEGKVDAMIFLVDPLYAHPHEPDIRTLLRVSELKNIPFATNAATAELLLERL